MTPSSTPAAPPADTAEWIGWLRIGRGPWQAVASGPTSADADRAIGEHLASMPDPPKHCESYVGLPGSKPPMPRGDDESWRCPIASAGHGRDQRTS